MVFVLCANCSLIADRNWEIEWFSKKPNRYWNNISNQRLFLDLFAKRHGIKNPSHWSRISVSQIEEEGGYSLLRTTKKYPILFHTLKRVYPGL